MSLVTATVLSEGAPIDKVFEIMSIDIRRNVNRLPYASLVLIDGDSAKRTFALSNAKYFEPGKNIEIKLRYEGKSADISVFKGPVVGHGVEASGRGSTLRVEMKDAAIKLAQGRKSQVFVEQTDAEAVRKLIEKGGVTVGTIDDTQPKHPQIVQYHCSDWDFIVSRAETQGLLVVAEDGKVSLRKPDLGASAAHKFDYGISEIYDFEFQIDAAAQYPGASSSGWDLKQGKLTAAAEAKAFVLKQGNLQGDKIAGTLGFKTQLLSHPVPVAQEELQAWADARLMRSRLSLIRGRVATAGFAPVKLLEVIEIAGVGKRFDGTTLVTGLRHRVDADGWRTDVQFGLSARAFALEEGVSDLPAAGLLPAIGGLHVGVVAGFEEDPDKQFRLKVILPGIDPEQGAVWARLASSDAGDKRGWFSRPEAGDEVVVGFFNSDPRQPVVLGSLFSPKNTPAAKYAEISEKNTMKVMVTKTGTAAGFIDDDKGLVFIETAGGGKVVVDDKEKSIAVTDQNGNTITMDKDGITIKSAKDLKFEASGNVEIKGAKVDLK
jgi:Rhs element Vgr protein